MFMSPLHMMSLWLRGLVAAAVLVICGLLWREWYRTSQTVLLVVAIITTAWAVGGGLLLERLRHRKGDEGLNHRRMGQGNEVMREDGSEIHVETDGHPEGPTVVLTHEWGMDGAEWNVVRPVLAKRYRLIVWDLPGSGYSSRPPGNDYSVKRMAEDLRHVVEFAGDRPMVLVGHGVGGIVIEEFCRAHPEMLAKGPVVGVVLAHSTYTNPLRTMEGGERWEKVQRPVTEPLLHASAALSPVLRMLSWLSYLNGSTHRSAERSGFSGKETWGKLGFVAKYELKSSPGVMARGALGVIQWDGEGVLGRVAVPALVVTGRRDPVAGPEAGRRIREGIAGAEGYEFDEGKHQGLVEFDEVFAERVERFVEKYVEPRERRPRVEGTGRPGETREDFEEKRRPDGTEGSSGGVAPEDWRERSPIQE